jgi:hypothetical protein
MLPKLCELQTKISDFHMREEKDSYKPNDGEFYVLLTVHPCIIL